MSKQNEEPVTYAATLGKVIPSLSVLSNLVVLTILIQCI